MRFHQMHIEKVHLVVSRDAIPLVVEDQAGGADFAVALCLQRDGSSNQPDSVTPGQLAEVLLQRAVAVAFTQG